MHMQNGLTPSMSSQEIIYIASPFNGIVTVIIHDPFTALWVIYVRWYLRGPPADMYVAMYYTFGGASNCQVTYVTANIVTRSINRYLLAERKL